MHKLDYDQLLILNFMFFHLKILVGNNKISKTETMRKSYCVGSVVGGVKLILIGKIQKKGGESESDSKDLLTNCSGHSRRTADIYTT